ncbi:NADH dehydrogenase (ubiquinone) 1 alpha subcomplex assembly factor 3 [Azospirillaceae bacterium]
MDITPLIPADRQVIHGYSPGEFVVNGVVHRHAVLVFPERVLAWPVTAFSEITIESLLPVCEAQPAVEILLLGCGLKIALLSSELRRAMRERGVRIEVMDTGAACRTYVVLLSEGRRVAAALLPV